MSKKVKYVLLLIIVGILVVISVMFVKKKYFDKMDSVISIYDEDKNKSSIYVNSKYVGEVEGEITIENNMNNSSYYLCSDEAVYFMNNEKIEEVGKGIELVAIANNSSEALLVNGEYSELYMYKASKLEVIAEESINMASISGDGKTYAYTTSEAAYVGSEPGKEVKVSDVVISHISDKGDYIYGVRYTNAEDESTKFDLLLIDDAGKTNVISENVTSINGLNATGTEIMYSTAEGTFVCIEGKESKKITDGQVYSIYYYDNEKSAYGDFWSIDTLKNVVCEVINDTGDSNERAICLISKEYVAEEIVTNCYEFLSINDKMSKVYYMDKENTLYCVNTKKGATAEKLAENVDFARVSPNGKHVYFVREDIDFSILYHIENGPWRTARRRRS